MSKSSLEAAAEAAAKVNAMLIAKGKLKLSPSNIKPKIGNSFLGRLKKVNDLVTAEVDINDAPLSARNLLTRGHIQEEICKTSGAAISTRGRYMTPEERKTVSSSECRPLYLNVQASSHESVRIAVSRIQEIIDQYVLATGGVKCPTAGVVTYSTSSCNGTSNQNSSNHIPSGAHFVQDKVFIGLEQTPADYPVQEKILGPGGSFLQHIRTETGATVTLRGKGSGFIEPISGREAFEPLYIHITHPKAEGLQAAKSLAINLVETAHVEFVQWQQTQQQAILQPLASVVIPQASPVAYQNQVIVTPAVLPVSANTLATGSSIVATGVQIPSGSVAGGTLTVPSLIQATPASLSGLTVPVSVQGIPSQTVLTYPTYVASQNTILARPATPIITRPVTPAVSIFSMLPPLPVSATYSVATSPQAIVSSQSQVLNQFQTQMSPIAFSQPLAYTRVPVSQAHFVQSSIAPTSVVVTPTTISYAVSSHFVAPVPSPLRTTFSPVAPPVAIQSTVYPRIHYPRFEFEHRKHKYYGGQESSYSMIRQPMQSLQESNSNHPTDSGNEQHRRGMARRPDKDLMPPPLTAPLSSEGTRGSQEQYSRPVHEPDRKRLKGALGGIASFYGSDDSSDEECGGPKS